MSSKFPTASASAGGASAAAGASSARGGSASAAVVISAARAICQLLAVISVTVWGFTGWSLPLPGLLTGIGILVLSVLVWAVFLSPRPVLHTDRFGQALIELLLIAGAVGALLALGFPWLGAAAFGVVAAVLGYLAAPAS